MSGLPPTARTFTRVTFASPGTRADVSVPDDLPVALLLPQVRDLLSVGGGRRWTLTHPVGGDLDPGATLRDVGVVDGQLLYLREHDDGYESPYVEDVAEEVAAVRVGPGWWSPGATRLALALVAGLWLALTGPVLLWRFGSAASSALVLVVAVVLAGTLAATLARDATLTAVLGWSLLPAAASLAAAVAGGASAPPAITVAVVAGGIGAATGVTGLLFVRGQGDLGWTVLVGTAAALLGVWIFGAAAALGLPVDRTAAVVGVLLLAAQSSLPRLATQLAGLGQLADSAADGAAVRRRQVQAASRRAHALLIGLLAGTGLAIAVMAAVLAAEGSVPQEVLATLLAVALLLRARRFSRALHVLPPAVAGLVGLFAVAVFQVRAAADAAPAVVAILALTAGSVLVGAAVLRPTRPAGARMRLALDRAELVVLLLCGPALLWVFDAFRWASSVVP